jgi:nicotinamide riboside kinase
MEKNLKQEQSAIVKIALFGPESTGKTTLAKQLALHYKTVWAPEFARDYLQEKWDKCKHICDISDMLPIAFGQIQLENEKLAVAKKYLFCDTNLLVTKVFSELYYNFCDPLLEKAAQEHQYDLFFLTDIDVPWEKDDLRDQKEGRESVFEMFKQSLIDNKKPFVMLSGSKDSRLKEAISIIDDLSEALDMGLSSSDLIQIYNKGISIKTVRQQLHFLQNRILKTDLVEPATIGNGLLQLSSIDVKTKSAFFDNNKHSLQLLKFVPASGAATRMFKFLITFLEEYDLKNETIQVYINRKKDSELPLFISSMEKFPFFEAIDTRLKTKFSNFETLSNDEKNFYFVKFLLATDYLNFANKPKGIIPFHKYPANIVTPVEEHLQECVSYSSANGISKLHFTVSEVHQQQFEKIIDSVKSKKEEESNIVISVSYSYQDERTDTVAVDIESNLFRDDFNQLIFRPGGHGSLIENLNALDADIIFIKNIDNVIYGNNEQIVMYKKALAGILVELQQQVFKYLKELDIEVITNLKLDEIRIFLETRLYGKVPDHYLNMTVKTKTELIQKALNKPIRVCGMVRNQGEPGGGPFWVRNSQGEISLQIVEGSQVDLENEQQRNILTAATHFNPVDIVCGIRNYKNERFNLEDFIDVDSGFIVDKTVLGKKIKGYELPGLWNGAMANWLTVFVEVPLITFNPVKTVNDLLKPGHQIL